MDRRRSRTSFGRTISPHQPRDGAEERERPRRLSVVDTVKTFLPQIRAAAPKDMKITPLFDQSVFVSDAIADVLREAVIAAG